LQCKQVGTNADGPMLLLRPPHCARVPLRTYAVGHALQLLYCVLFEHNTHAHIGRRSTAAVYHHGGALHSDAARMCV
jgi:hypothetical protein